MEDRELEENIRKILADLKLPKDVFPEEIFSIATEKVEPLKNLLSLLDDREGKHRLCLSSPSRYEELALFSYACGDFTSAIRFADKAIRAGSKENALFMKSLALMKTSNSKKAVGCLSDLIASAPENSPYLWKAWLLQGNALQTRGLCQRALECYEKALKYNPGSAHTLLSIGHCFVDLKKFEKARDAYRQATEKNPESKNKIVEKLQLLLKEAKDRRSISNLKDLVALAPDYEPALVLLGQFYEDNELLDEALKSYEQALKLNEDNREAREMHARCLAKWREKHKCPVCNASGNCVTCESKGHCFVCRGSGKCMLCSGKGKCKLCGGSGKCVKCKGSGREKLVKKCLRCNGSGLCNKCKKGKCPRCNGSGKCDLCRGRKKCKTCGGSGICLKCEGKRFIE